MNPAPARASRSRRRTTPRALTARARTAVTPVSCALTGRPLRRRARVAAKSARRTCPTPTCALPAVRARSTTTTCRRRRPGRAPRECAALARSLPAHASPCVPHANRLHIPRASRPHPFPVCLPLCVPCYCAPCVRRGRAPNPRPASVGMPRAVRVRPRAALVCVCACVRAVRRAVCSRACARACVCVCPRRLRPLASTEPAPTT